MINNTEKKGISMTVEDLINELMKVSDKMKEVKFNIKIEDDYSYDNVAKDVREQSDVIIYNW